MLFVAHYYYIRMEFDFEDTIFCELGLWSTEPTADEAEVFEEEFLTDDKPLRFKVTFPEMCFVIDRDKHQFFLLHRHKDVYDEIGERMMTDAEVDAITMRIIKIAAALGMEVILEEQFSN